MWWLVTSERVLRDRDRVLQLCADGEHVAARLDRKGERFGGVAAGAPECLQPAVRRSHDRVVAANEDRPVVSQHAIDERAEPLDGVVVQVGDGIVGEVAARHDEGAPDSAHQQMVQWRIGQHDSELGQARGNPLSESGARCSRCEHDRPPSRRERLGADLVEIAEPSRHLRGSPP